jgi:hypothetical protein
MKHPVPTAALIRKALLKRASDYAKLTGLKLGTVSDRCAGDGKFLHQVQRGENFTVDRYQRAMDWLDANWPNTGSRAA